MDSIDTPRLIYLLILGIALGGWFLVQARGSFNRTLQHAAVWGLIFLGAIAAAGLWQDIQRTSRPDQISVLGNDRIAIPRAPDGHYYVTAEVNGQLLRFVVDTGATDLVLSHSDAQKAGLDPAALNYFGRATTANGAVETAPVRLDTVTLGPVTDKNVPAVVNAGEMRNSLLGMGYLQRWGKIEIGGGEMVLTR